jgi:uncharacterized damage-inducible protein DinB
MSDLRYPIGPLEIADEVGEERRQVLIRQIAETPANLSNAVRGLTPEQLDTPYRPLGWTVRQVVHHLADSHINWYVRTRLVLTEEHPVVKPYDQVLWAELADARSGPVEPSLALLETLHQRWTSLLESLSPADWSRTMSHPERGELTLAATLSMHAWHGRHHVAQITTLRKRAGWD